MKNFLLFSLTIFAVFPSFSQSDSILRNQAFEYYDKADYQEAFELFSECINLDSTDLILYEKAGRSAQLLGMIPQAREMYIQLEKRDTFNKTALVQLASIYEQEKYIPKAIKYYTKLTELYSDNGLYYRKLAQQYASAGLKTDAFKNYSRAHKLNGKDLITIKGLAEIFLSNNQLEDADSILVEGIKLDTLNIGLHQLIARSKYKQKEYQSTIDYLSKINRRVDLNPYFNKLLGFSFIQIDSFETAVYYLNKSLVDEGSKEFAHYYLATAYEKMDSTEAAVFHYEKALEEGISANVPNYHRNLARIHNSGKNLKEAIPHYKDAYKYSEDALILFYLARASDSYYKDPSIAINYYSKYIKSGHDHKEYMDYAKSRRRQLKEFKHQNSN